MRLVEVLYAFLLFLKIDLVNRRTTVGGLFARVQ